MKICNRCKVLKESFEFSAHPSSPDRKQYHCRECGKEYSIIRRRKEGINPPKRNTVEQRKQYLSDWRAANRHKQRERDKRTRVERTEREARRRAMKKTTMVEKVTYEEVKERYGDICYLCNTQINWKLKWPALKSKSFDHMIPLARGGTHTYENIRLTHLACNMSKGNKVVN